MKKSLRVIALILVISAFTAVALLPTSAAFQPKGYFDRGTGINERRYYVFKDSVGAYVMYHSKDVCPPLYHYVNTGTIELQYARSVTISSETAHSFSSSLGLTASSMEIISASVEIAGGRTHTSGYSISATGSVGTTLGKESPTGYYKLTPCQNFHQFHVECYRIYGAYDELLSQENFYVPEDETYLATLYKEEGGSYHIYTGK